MSISQNTQHGRSLSSDLNSDENNIIMSTNRPTIRQPATATALIFVFCKSSTENTNRCVVVATEQTAMTTRHWPENLASGNFKELLKKIHSNKRFGLNNSSQKPLNNGSNRFWRWATIRRKMNSFPSILKLWISSSTVSVALARNSENQFIWVIWNGFWLWSFIGKEYVWSFGKRSDELESQHRQVAASVMMSHLEPFHRQMEC